MTAFNMGPLRVYLDDLTGRLSVGAFIRIMDMEECGKRTVNISRIRTALLAYSTQNPIYTAHKMIGKIGNAIRITFYRGGEDLLAAVLLRATPVDRDGQDVVLGQAQARRSPVAHVAIRTLLHSRDESGVA